MENSWYWLVIVGVLVVFYILLMVRQKRQEKKNQEALESFRVGDKVITHIGIFGKIKRIYNTTYGKICVLEVGTNNKVDIEMDLRYVAAIDEKTIAPEDPKPEIKEEQKKEEKKSKKQSQLIENSKLEENQTAENQEIKKETTTEKNEEVKAE